MIGYRFNEKKNIASFKIEIEHWLNFLRLVNIIDLVYSFVYNERTIREMRQLISEYLKQFRKLYPSINFIPKMHFLVHFPNQMDNFGPLRLHSTNRFEASGSSVL